MGLLRSFGLESVGSRVGRYLYSEQKVTSGSKDEQVGAGKQASGKVVAEEMQEMNKGVTILRADSEMTEEATMAGAESHKAAEEDGDYDGPDTSSLAAFVISFLTYTPQRGRYATSSSSEGQSDEDEDEADGDKKGLRGEESTSGQQRSSFLGFSFSRKFSWGRDTGRDGADSGQVKEDEWIEAGESASGAQRLVKKTSAKSLFGDSADGSRREIGPAVEADWHLVYGGELARTKSFGPGTEKPLQVPELAKTPKTPRSPLKLPHMSEESVLLTEASRCVIYDALPALAKGREWVLLYSTMKHGMSLLTLYRRSELCQGPCLLVVGCKDGAVFGGLSSGPLRPSTKKKYQGNSECFVFTDVSGTPQLFRATGANRYFVLCMNDALAMGGGGHFAFQIDGELLHGTSGVCETFKSTCLAKSEDFLVKRVELWGFAHASRYAPKASAWHEPEVSPGIHTW